MLTGYIEGYYGSLLDWNQRLKILESLSALISTHTFTAKRRSIS